MAKSTTKQQRKYAQDFSGNSLTDESFAPSCDVNNIVTHYQQTGIDPYIDRKKLERFEPASTIPYSDAMRHVAEVDSAFALLPSHERASHGNDPQIWLDSIPAAEAPTEPPEGSPSPPADPPPEDSTGSDSGEKVQ